MLRCLLCLLAMVPSGLLLASDRPNFLFVITDDQSWAHTSYAGYPHVKTPAFDRIASEGVYFNRAFASAPTCTASRSAILSGRHFWQTGSGALLWGEYPHELPNFIHQLAEYGYFTGYTGKGWGPGVAKENDYPTGTPFNKYLKESSVGYTGLAGYAENFNDFLLRRNPSKPFFFWAGIFEPHRGYLKSDINRFSARSQDASWPPIMPYNGRSQKQMTRYLEEIEYGDAEVQKMLGMLESHHLLENTIVIYTSDNGMPFAGAKATLYQYGVQVPLAIRLPESYAGKSGKTNELASLIDIAPTVLELAKVPALDGSMGQSLLPLLTTRSDRGWDPREFVLIGFERHAANARPDSSTYPMRGLISDDWLYIRNYKPERWPQGSPDTFRDTFMVHLQTYKGENIEPYYTSLLSKRPERELYRWGDPPGVMHNKAADDNMTDIATALDSQLESALRVAHDPGLEARDYFRRYQVKSGEHTEEDELP
ncbi:MAG: hypothetical protein EP312_10295 [Gammaproteobacteria bacterium]|nr:MAG: hypothetical protein EP312_10295 [Gammaproteobacteria bacterium]